MAGLTSNPSICPRHFPALPDHVDLPPATLMIFISNYQVLVSHLCLDNSFFYLCVTSKGLKHLPLPSQPRRQTTISPSAFNKPWMLSSKWPLSTQLVTGSANTWLPWCLPRIMASLFCCLHLSQGLCNYLVFCLFVVNVYLCVLTTGCIFGTTDLLLPT